MDRGYFKLFRKIDTHWLWNDKPFSRGQAWIDLVKDAHHADKPFEFLLSFSNIKIVLEKGELFTSTSKLSERWGWSAKKVRSFLQLLEREQMIMKKGGTKGTTISIVRYADYADWGEQKGKQRASRGQAEGNKQECKNGKNGKKEKIDKKERKKTAPVKKPKGTEINPFIELEKKWIEFAEKKGMTKATIKLQFEKFVGHHKTKGSVFKDWDQAWRTWVLNWVEFGSRQVQPNPKNGYSNNPRETQKIPKEQEDSDRANLCYRKCYGDCKQNKDCCYKCPVVLGTAA